MYDLASLNRYLHLSVEQLEPNFGRRSYAPFSPFCSLYLFCTHISRSLDLSPLIFETFYAYSVIFRSLQCSDSSRCGIRTAFSIVFD